MTTIDPTAEVIASSAEAGDSALGRLLASVADWLTSTDHKKIGRLFLGGGLLGLFGTVAINVILGIERSGIGNMTSCTARGTFSEGAGASSLGVSRVALRLYHRRCLYRASEALSRIDLESMH